MVKKFSREYVKHHPPLKDSRFCIVSWSRETIEGNPLLEAANSINSNRSSSISSMDSLASLRVVALSDAAFSLASSFSLRSSSFCCLLSALTNKKWRKDKRVSFRNHYWFGEGRLQLKQKACNICFSNVLSKIPSVKISPSFHFHVFPPVEISLAVVAFRASSSLLLSAFHVLASPSPSLFAHLSCQRNREH